ncbi:cellulose synthase catalytic subunit [Gordonia sp. ABSL11-1]|uniref:glycosyltransferase family 2 protein n=1 Tax=Gordonia sp. ABSL11-1 TaxID=3053924 RepID=UPI002573245C|nr:cellulose synthase catalytic subunit [Gordonia sp. ABSL11-1]MDL9948718.1 cellulose synthase catalytic subunit [Gordonia sp. ABSL11-1]
MRWVQIFLIAAFLLAAWSLIAFSTAHPMLWPALIVLVANVIGTTFSIITGLNPRRVTWRSHRQLTSGWRPAGRFPSVDVFLPTCGEDLAILDNTYRHIAALEWSGALTAHVLDDADRPEVRALAAEYGFAYVVRPDRGHLRKAGNLRYAFSITAADLIVIFDADFCPRPDFLAHLVPYLDDPEVAIAQSPQCFATTEAMGWVQRTAGATQEFFYRWVLPSRDRIGAANCVGTSAVYRRSALNRVGGFAAIEHSEDLHTGRHLQQAGYDIRYVPVVLSRGLCPPDLAGFLNQQYRWCQGSLSRLVHSELADPPRRPTALQRCALWAGVFYYLTTAMNVFLLFLPGIIMAGFYPEDVHPAQLVPFLLGLWVYVVLFPLVSRTRWRFEVLRIQIAYSFAHTIAIWHKLIGREIGWVPTGAIGKTNSLGRSISALGTLVLGSSLVAFWVVTVLAVRECGLAEFWMMAGFVLAYTYLAAPLFVAFVRVLLPRAARVVETVSEGSSDDSLLPTRADLVDGSDGVDSTGRRPTGPNWNRISGFEVVGYTIAILFIGALALGWFDIMLPWTAA